jgi:transcriptional regulator with XRE-family HTH domain
MGAMEKSIYTPEYAALRLELRKIRKNARLSQRDLASRLKVPHSWVAKVETGERRIDLIEFCRFISACGMDPLVVSKRMLRQMLARKSGRLGKVAHFNDAP